MTAHIMARAIMPATAEVTAGMSVATEAETAVTEPEGWGQNLNLPSEYRFISTGEAYDQAKPILEDVNMKGGIGSTQARRLNAGSGVTVGRDSRDRRLVWSLEKEKRRQ